MAQIKKAVSLSLSKAALIAKFLAMKKAPLKTSRAFKCLSQKLFFLALDLHISPAQRIYQCFVFSGHLIFLFNTANNQFTFLDLYLVIIIADKFICY